MAKKLTAPKPGIKATAKAKPKCAAREAAHKWCDAFNAKLAELLESADKTLAEVRNVRHPIAGHIQEMALEELVWRLENAVGLAVLEPHTADHAPAVLPSAGALMRSKSGRAKG